MKRLLALAGVLMLNVSCGSDDSGGAAAAPIVNPAKFVAKVNHPRFPLTSGMAHVYEAVTPDGLERVENLVLHQTKVILGVTCTVLLNRCWLDDELVEEASDWFAQDVDGTVWYFGEESKEIENGVVVSTAGSWQAGVNGAVPGIVMLAAPVVGQSYFQENAPGVAIDKGEVVSLTATVTIPFGTYTNCWKIKETNPLDPATLEFKYYAAGVGLVLVEEPGFEVELVEISP